MAAVLRPVDARLADEVLDVFPCAYCAHAVVAGRLRVGTGVHGEWLYVSWHDVGCKTWDRQGWCLRGSAAEVSWGRNWGERCLFPTAGVCGDEGCVRSCAGTRGMDRHEPPAPIAWPGEVVSFVVVRVGGEARARGVVPPRRRRPCRRRSPLRPRSPRRGVMRCLVALRPSPSSPLRPVAGKPPRRPCEWRPGRV